MAARGGGVGTTEAGGEPAAAPLRAGGLRVLALDGGAIRGLFTLDVLRRIEAATRRPIRECFDLIVGTSTGGFIATRLLAGQSVEGIEAEYRTILASFRDAAPSLASFLKRFTRGHVLDGNLMLRLLRGTWKESRLADLPPTPRLLIVATQADVALPQPFLIRNQPVDATAAARTRFDYTADAPMVDVVRCCTAAPTFYGPHTLGDRVIVDGAIHSNNPILFAVAEAAAVFPDTPIAMLLSVGTGERRVEHQGQAPTGRHDGNLGMLGWTSSLLEQTTSTEHPHLLALAMLGPARYHRVNPGGGGDLFIWEHDDAVIARHRAAVAAWLDKHAGELAEVCAKLV